MKSPWNDSHNLSLNAYVQSLIYWEFYHDIVDIANEGHYKTFKHKLPQFWHRKALLKFNNNNGKFYFTVKCYITFIFLQIYVIY